MSYKQTIPFLINQLFEIIINYDNVDIDDEDVDEDTENK